GNLGGEGGGGDHGRRSHKRCDLGAVCSFSVAKIGVLGELYGFVAEKAILCCRNSLPASFFERSEAVVPLGWSADGPSPDLGLQKSVFRVYLLLHPACSLLRFVDAEAHKRYGGLGTVLVIKVPKLVSAESANQFGELVADPVTNELLHYTEKPETFVSMQFLLLLFQQPNLRRMNSFEALQSATKYEQQHLSFDECFFNMLTFVLSRTLPADYVRLDQDILSPLAGKKKLYTYETLDFWEQIKTPG
ncbi:hypothetical protein BHE74_00027436, partial [Ensete ventricosum]